jgi:hypothetical protein
MKSMTREQMRQVVRQWVAAGPELQRVRDGELLDRPYDWRVVDALLDLGVRFKRPREECGLVLMQEWFVRFASALEAEVR